MVNLSQILYWLTPLTSFPVAEIEVVSIIASVGETDHIEVNPLVKSFRKDDRFKGFSAEIA